MNNEDKINISQAIAVEGRDDVRAVREACNALIIPTHGYGISAETWRLLDKAYEEKGLIILTDPDSAGKRIRKRLTEKYPDAVQAELAREDAVKDDDIGIENARPEAIKEALIKALDNSERAKDEKKLLSDPVTCNDLARLGLTGSEGAAYLRAEVCRELGIGYGNAKAMLRKLNDFGIGRNELEETIETIRNKTC